MAWKLQVVELQAMEPVVVRQLQELELVFEQVVSLEAGQTLQSQQWEQAAGLFRASSQH